MIDLQSGNDV